MIISVFRTIKKFNTLLSTHQKIRIAELIVYMIVGGFLEMLSVSLILPFMNAVMNPEQIMQNKYAECFCELFNISNVSIFMALLAIIMALIYIAKNAFLILETNIQNKFVKGNMLKLQEQLLGNILSRPYEYFLHVNSGELVRLVHNDAESVFSLLLSILSLFTELIVSSMIIVATFVADPGITGLIAGVLLFLLTGVSLFIKPRLHVIGNDARAARSGTYKWLIQVIEGIKEVKVMCREDFFKASFLKHGETSINCARKHAILRMIPRFLIEAVCMSMMFVLIAVMILRGKDLRSLIPVLTTVAMAAMRLLPSSSRIASTFALIAYSEPVLDKMIETLNNIEDDGQRTKILVKEKNNAGVHKSISKFNDVIKIDNVSYHYPSLERNVLSDASMSIQCGESVGIIGSSGTGKTTSVDILLGLLHPQKGTITVDGIDIREDIKGWLSLIGYIPQMIFMLDDTIRANVAFGINRDEVDDNQVWKALEEAALKDFVFGLPDKLDTKIGERGVRVSGGQRQRIGIARALYKNPPILFFDEATSSLDNETEKAIIESVNGLKGRKTMVIIAHRLTTIEKCDRVYRIEDGKIS